MSQFQHSNLYQTTQTLHEILGDKYDLQDLTTFIGHWTCHDEQSFVDLTLIRLTNQTLLELTIK